MTLLAGTLLLVAAIHRSGLETANYTQSPLIGVEMTLMLIYFGSLIILHPLGLLLLLNKDARKLLPIPAASLVISLPLVGAAMMIDAPTLIYMT